MLVGELCRGAALPKNSYSRQHPACRMSCVRRMGLTLQITKHSFPTTGDQLDETNPFLFPSDGSRRVARRTDLWCARERLLDRHQAGAVVMRRRLVRLLAAVRAERLRAVHAELEHAEW